MFRYSMFILLIMGFFLTITPAAAAEPSFAPVSVAVTLDSFEALPDANGVRVVWATVSESNTLGFRIFRGTTPDGPLVRLTALIPTQAPNGGGARYEFVDTSAQAGNTYYYYLDAVGTNGQTVRYGPAVIDLTPTAVTVGNFNAERANVPWGWLTVVAAQLTLLAVAYIRRRR